MKMRVTEILPTPSGLVLGVQVRGPKDSWLKFAQLEVPWESVDRSVIEAWSAFYERQRAREIEDLDVPIEYDWA